MNPTLLIGDIVERESKIKPLADFSDTTISSSTGFPEHKQRWKSSAFKQRLAGNATSINTPRNKQNSSVAGASGPTQSVSFEENERKRIDQENRQRLDVMSPEEIAQAQREIMGGLDPTLVQRLLQRSTIEDSKPSPFDTPPTTKQNSEHQLPKVEDDYEPDEPSDPQSQKATTEENPNLSKEKGLFNEDAAPAQMPPDLFPITEGPKHTHFPKAPPLPDLDPSDPNFLQTLHKKYFPNLPNDPSKLAWMAPVPTKGSVADKESPYYPHEEIAVSALRFDFKGRFLSPRVSRSIPSTKGLHNHGLAPEAAGYTIEELAILARSAVPAQRCIAFQTLGRIMYRLGTGEWGKSEDDPIAMGVWASIKKGRVLDTLVEAAAGEGGHQGSRAYATEAVWLFEKGGWKEKFKGR